MGGKVDGAVSVSTDSGVRIGQSVHSVQLPVGPVSRSASDTTPSRQARPRYVRDTTVVVQLCTLDTCAHCCKCHLRHNKTGYGRCMKSASVPWPDCECAGKCAAGRCAQPECASNCVVVDLTSSPPVSGSQSTPTPHAALSQQEAQQQHDNDRHQPGVSAVSHSPTPSPPLPGARREAGGVHDGEEVCVGPQADTHASSSAAYRQPSATVTDSRSAASQAVEEADGSETTAHTTGTSGGVVQLSPTPPVDDVPINRQLPKAVLDELPSLSHRPRRLPVLADGRCSVASVLLACGMIEDAHINEQGRQTIDAERRRLGNAMVDKWTETDWIRRVPIHVRGAHMPFINTTDKTDLRRHRSHQRYHQLLTEAPPTTWLDYGVLYLASAEYDVCIFVIYTVGSEQWRCERIGGKSDRHIVLYHASGHYECAEYDGLRVFSPDHEFTVRISEFAARHPERPYEEDIELRALEAQEKATAQTPQTAKRATPKSKRRGHSKVARPLDLSDNVTAPKAEPDRSEGVKPLPPLIAQVAEHGPLYERVSFHNQPQWRAANEPLWNAYRLASMTGQRSRLTPILLDILRLPQRVLPKLGRSGRAARRRSTAATGHRLRSEAQTLRARYGCPDPDPKAEQQTQMSTDTMAHTTAHGGYERPRRAASIAAAEAIRHQAADTTDAGSDADSDVEATQSRSNDADSEDDSDDPYPSLNRHGRRHSEHPDSRAARRANYLVQCGLTRKAAQTLHSTTQIADLRTAAAQETMLQMHPRPPHNTALPTVPEGAPPSVLEDDTGLRRLLTQSDNGTSAGPSGWGGNMLAILVQSDICRLGVVALLKDIINGELPKDARQLLLASRLVALTKPNSDGFRPIAVGEVFYRLAAIVAVKRVSNEAAELLKPHQYGIGVAAGAEKILHSLQHELTDTDKRLALLQLDITNAFNSCDRARVLGELYALPDLQPLFRIADFAYSQPSALVLSGCDGLIIESAQGVRQGDPLSALLFCVYMRQVLRQVSEKTGVKVYGFFDDINLLGTPQQLMEALSHLQHSLPAVSMQLNTAKSHFAYFHDQLTPLTSSVLGALSTNDIQLHHDWVGVVGVVVGRDDAAIRAGMHCVLSAAGSHDAFLRRLQLDDMPIQTAMLLLRQCMVPAMQYYLRCIAPMCIEDEARHFDERMMGVAMDKLGLHEGERGERTVTLLQRKLRDGGWSLSSAVRTSPAAFLGSLAACHTVPVFSQYSGATPVPYSSQLHGWVDDSLQRVRQAAPDQEYQSDLEPLLPATVGNFFSFYSDAGPSVTTVLQRSLNAKATSHNLKAAVQQMKEQSRQGEKWELAHHKAITAKGAWGWKAVRPVDPHSRLSDVECAIAARLNLGLKPLSARAMAALPEHCPLCTHHVTGLPVPLCAEPWHLLTCSHLMKGEISRRHDAVVDAIARVALLVGAQVRQEVNGLDPHSKQRPDLEIVFPGRILLTDVVVSHQLTPYRVEQRGSAATKKQNQKRRKYAGAASRLGAELLNVSIDTCGGLASEAIQLVQCIGEEGERWSAGTWSSSSIERQLFDAIAVAVQRGNALSVLAGFTRSSRARSSGTHGRTTAARQIGEGRQSEGGRDVGEV